MATSRRAILQAAGAGLAASALTGCAQIAARLPRKELPATLTPPSTKVAQSVRILNRAAYGPLPGQAREVEQMGFAAWVDEQLEKPFTDDLRLQSQLMRLDVLRVDGMELRDFPEDVMVHQFNQAILLRAAYSQNQLFERMVDFWSNHFNIYARKGLASYRKAKDEKEVVRDHAFGRFPDMLKASARSPAMLAYLDNEFSRKEAPNENYARELMELHTLGVKSGYTQKDVHEVARCFTGWGIERRFLHAKGTFLFDEDKHDKGEKVVLGHRIPAGRGVEDGEQVLEILAHDPRTASFVAAKLCRYFLGSEHSPMRPKVAATYTKTGGDIPAMVRQILLSEECLDGAPIAKRPIDFLVSSLRAVNAESDCGEGLQAHLREMGQSVYEWPMPDGYPDGAEPWTGSLLARWNFAIALGDRAVPGTRVDLDDLKARTGAPDARSAMATVLNLPAADPAVPTGATLSEASALLLCRPEFQWR